jgi:hypothetical protein
MQMAAVNKVEQKHMKLQLVREKTRQEELSKELEHAYSKIINQALPA